MPNKTPYIQVLGSGCYTCKKLFELTSIVVRELGIETNVDYVTDIQKILDMGIMSSPVLTVNGKPVMVGSVPDKEKIKELISKNMTA